LRDQVCEEDLAWLREYRTEELCEVFDAVHLDLVAADTKVGFHSLSWPWDKSFVFKELCHDSPVEYFF